MSTEVPTVALDGEAMVPLVRAAGALTAADLPPCSIIGGVAVAVRLGRAVRATADLDAVTDDRFTPTALDVLRRREDAVYDPAEPHSIVVAGAEIQFQDVAPVDDAEIAELDGTDLLYVAGHAHALGAATPVRIVAADRGAPVTAVVRVAPAGALVAMKLHAYLDRRRVAGPDKRPGDLWDIYHLLLHLGRETASDLATASPRLCAVVADLTRAHLVDGAARARAVLRLSSDARYEAITADELRFVADAFIDDLDRAG